MKDGYQSYYVPEQSKWPFIGSVGLFSFAIGAATFVQGRPFGPYIFAVGVAILVYMMCGWFCHVIDESDKGLYSKQMDRSFIWGMVWFIFSEVMFFAAFFGALLYIRMWAVPWLGGAGNNAATNQQQQTRGHNCLFSEAGDQFARKEAWAEHGQNVPGYAERGVVCGMATSHHGKRSTSHHKCHERVSHNSA